MRGDGLFTFDIHTRELKPVEGVGNIVMSVQRAADGSIETTAAMIEAGNKGMTTLKNVTVQNSNTTASGVIVNKSNGQLTLNDVKFVGCKMIVAEASNIAARRAASTDTSKGIVFVGTNNVKLVGAITLSRTAPPISMWRRRTAWTARRLTTPHLSRSWLTATVKQACW